MNNPAKSNSELLLEIEKLELENASLKVFCEEVLAKDKLWELELNEIKRRLDDTQEVARVGSWETDLSNFEVKWSAETFRIFGLDPNSIHTTHPNFLNYVHPDDREKADKALFDSLSSHSINTIQHRIITPKGELRYIEENWRIFYNEQGKAIRALGTCSDITERKLAEEKLKSSEEKFRTLFINHSAIKLIFDPLDGQIFDANIAAAQYYGWSIEEMRQMKISQINIFSLAEIRKDIKSVLNQEKNYFEFKHRKANGEIRDVSTNSGKVIIDGKPYIHSIISDITDRKSIELELQEKIVLMENSHELAQLGSFKIDLPTRSILLSPEMARLLGAGEEALQFPLEEYRKRFYHPGDLDRGSSLADAAYHSKATFPLDSRVIRTDGQVIWLHSRSKTFGNGSTILGMVQDITDSKIAEESLKASEEKYRFIFDNAIEGMYRTSIEGRSLMANPALATMLGYNSTDEYLMEMNDSANQVWFDGSQRSKYISLLEKHNIIKGYECQLKQKNGNPIWVSLNAKMVQDENGNNIYSEGFIEEINERKKAEFELIAAKEKAEESNNLKTAFLNNISHEIRTPFNGLLGFLSLFRSDNLSNEELDEYIQIITESANRLMNTLNEIVEISKIQTGQINFNESLINLKKLCEEISVSLELDAKGKGNNGLFLNNLPDNIEWIATDREKLFTILSYLISNAIKFTKDGTITVGLSKKGDCIEFFVSDTGIGIPKEKQSMIFERFNQAEFSNTRNYEGPGLGLTIAKAYVELLGGRIWVDSIEGKGSTFYFTIPYVDFNTISFDRIVIPGQTQLSRIKILIVEDDKYSSMLIEIIVKKFCKQVMKAESGTEAIKVCSSNPDIDLILMDLRMPETDGYEATRQIRQFNKDVVIIAQSAYALLGDREKAIDAGCNDYITKPINPSALKGLLQTYFKNLI